MRPARPAVHHQREPELAALPQPRARHGVPCVEHPVGETPVEECEPVRAGTDEVRLEGERHQGRVPWIRRLRGHRERSSLDPVQEEHRRDPWMSIRATGQGEALVAVLVEVDPDIMGPHAGEPPLDPACAPATEAVGERMDRQLRCCRRPSVERTPEGRLVRAPKSLGPERENAAAKSSKDARRERLVDDLDQGALRPCGACARAQSSAVTAAANASGASCGRLCPTPGTVW